MKTSGLWIYDGYQGCASGVVLLFFFVCLSPVFYLCLLLDDLQDGSVPCVFEFLHYHPVRKRHRLRHGGPLRPRVPRKEVRAKHLNRDQMITAKLVKLSGSGMCVIVFNRLLIG